MASKRRSISSFPGGLALREAHDIAEQVEDGDPPRCRRDHAPCRPISSRWPRPRAARSSSDEPAEVERAVVAVTGRPPRSVRILHTDTGLVVLLTLALDGRTPLAEAHDEASAVSRSVREALPDVADVVVHTEP